MLQHPPPSHQTPSSFKVCITRWCSHENQHPNWIPVLSADCSVAYHRIILRLLKLPVWVGRRLVISSVCLNNYVNSFMEIVTVQLHPWERWAIWEFEIMVLMLWVLIARVKLQCYSIQYARSPTQMYTF